MKMFYSWEVTADLTLKSQAILSSSCNFISPTQHTYTMKHETQKNANGNIYCTKRRILAVIILLCLLCIFKITSPRVIFLLISFLHKILSCLTNTGLKGTVSYQEVSHGENQMAGKLWGSTAFQPYHYSLNMMRHLKAFLC